MASGLEYGSGDVVEVLKSLTKIKIDKDWSKSKTKSINMYDLRQDDIIVNLWKRLEEKYKHLDMPHRYIYCLFKFSQSKGDILTTIKEWEHFDDQGNARGESNCICSHPIKILIYIRNKYNHNILRVGSDCIIKTPGNDELVESVRIYILQHQYQQQRIQTHRFCAGCLKHSISGNYKSTYTLCYNCNMNKIQPKTFLYYDGRKCKNCHKPTIAPWAAKYITICTQCCNEAPALFLRQCYDCGDYNIHQSAPPTYIRCLDCNMKKAKAKVVKIESSFPPKMTILPEEMEELMRNRIPYHITYPGILRLN